MLKIQKIISLATMLLLILSSASCASLYQYSVPNFKDRTLYLHPEKPELFYNWYEEYRCGFLNLAHCYRQKSESIDLTKPEERKRLIDAGFVMRASR